ncbi:MAG TPA: hypothetical protein VK541_08520 [Pedobacter sp.]|uniref:hypothetical protein n=1 Tax=Pedobacter sp. TaxID=1411316 RepID=UPI002CD93BAE|nr:hypothetical protein [Pedobacter sp.]HMI02510.1 hypothetical protein [Pedobacter sp.]
MKDLLNSVIDRKNILNNHDVLRELYKSLKFLEVCFLSRKYSYTKQQVAIFFRSMSARLTGFWKSTEWNWNIEANEVFTGKVEAV